MNFLGIDTSNYTTSLAVSNGGRVEKNLKKLLDVPKGQRGLRQSDALFSHVSRLPEMFAVLGDVHPAAVGVSDKPRNVDGSYMPCFLAGVSAASAVSSSFGVPLYRFSHQEGHIAAALYSCGREDLTNGEFLALHLSGGTTELLHVKGRKAEIIGKTLDISAGMLIDRVGVLCGLGFPCGAEMERISKDIPLSSPKVAICGTDCNLSGAENKAIEMKKKGVPDGEIFAFAFSYACETISGMIKNAVNGFPTLPVICSGGVCSNQRIRKTLEERHGCLFAKPEFSSDNAAGISRLCEMKFNNELL